MNLNINLRNAIVTLMFLVLVTPLVVSTSMFFPFVAGKGFFFRTIVEIALALYLILAIRDRSYLPRKSVVAYSLLALLGVMAISTLLSQNPEKSFWSNYERMEGYSMLLHLGAYFLILSSVFTKNIWNWFLNTSLVSSVVIGAYAFSMDRFIENPIGRIQGTLGNSTYLGVFALIHIFLAGYLALRLIERRGGFHKSTGSVIAYIAAGLFNVFVMYSTGTRGSFVGLIVGAVVTTILIAIFEKGRPMMRKIAIGACAAVILIILTLGATKSTEFVKSSSLLSRFASLITLDVGSVLKEQGYARSLIWGMAFEGFKARPVFGWGQESFNYVFAQYYNPKMYAQEQWFDRSHNVFFDWLIAGGALGLLSYLSLFAAIVYLIWKKSEHDDEAWTVAEKAVLTGLLVAYFVHNIFVFDNLISYILFFMLLAYVHQRSTSHGKSHHHDALVKSETNQIMASTAVIVLAIASLYYAVYIPYSQNINLINALRANAGATSKGAPLAGAEKGAQTLMYFQKAIASNTLGRFEVRERMAEVGPSVVTDPTNSKETIQGFENMVQSEFRDQISKTPTDPRPYMFLGMYLLQTSRIDAAIEVYKKAVEISPNKQSFLIQLGVAEYANKNIEAALPLLKRAYELEKSSKEALAVYATMLTYAKMDAELNAVLAEGLANGVDVSEDPRFLQSLSDTKNFTRLIQIIEKKIAANPNDAQTRVSAAAAYIKLGNRQAAIRELRKAIELEPLFKTQGEGYIKDIQEGRDPSEQ